LLWRSSLTLIVKLLMTLSWSRTLSGLLAVIYIICAFVGQGAEAGCKVILLVIFPLACIWFSEAMGRFTGPTTGIAITAPSPGLIVRILGWVVLLLPLIFLMV
jgi:membrane-anchored protein YejM (alkaline phosphatase superfamily)